ncbi:MAG TPA: hypothetical protein PKD59_03110 [Miltoncostaeaceae bacterium]|nr:hypothetical protein [Miltoncostaeaceae bacterium]
MAEYDDDRPDFDAVFADDPETERPSRRRLSRRREDDAADGSTGEIPRAASSGAPPPGSASAGSGATPSGASGSGSVPPEDDFGFGDGVDEGPPPDRDRGRSSTRSGSRSRSRGSSRAGAGGRARGTASRPRNGGGGRRGGASGGAAVLQQPRARLVALIVFAVILVVVIALVVKDCQRSQLEDKYTSYINGVAQIQTTSAEQGARLRQVMANPRGQRPPQLRAAILAISKDAQGLVDQAEGLDPPGALNAPQRSLITALEYRVAGLNSLGDNLPALLQRDDAQTKAAGIAKPMQRFLASDVIYEDSFKGPAIKSLEDDDITGIEVPALQPFLPNASYASPDGAKALLPDLQRRTAASGGGGDSGSTGNLRGTSLESTVALPSETRLVPGQVATVQTSELLKWSVTVKNGGDFDEKDVVVRASFSYSATPNDVDTREVSIPSIASGETTSVEIPGPSADKVVFGEQGLLVIEVEAVSGETRIDNNKAEYPVKITV